MPMVPRCALRARKWVNESQVNRDGASYSRWENGLFPTQKGREIDLNAKGPQRGEGKRRRGCSYHRYKGPPFPGMGNITHY